MTREDISSRINELAREIRDNEQENWLMEREIEDLEYQLESMEDE